MTGGAHGGTLTLLIDSEKLQNFASTSCLVNFSLWSKHRSVTTAVLLG